MYLISGFWVLSGPHYCPKSPKWAQMPPAATTLQPRNRVCSYLILGFWVPSPTATTSQTAKSTTNIPNPQDNSNVNLKEGTWRGKVFVPVPKKIVHFLIHIYNIFIINKLPTQTCEPRHEKCSQFLATFFVSGFSDFSIVPNMKNTANLAMFLARYSWYRSKIK